jgi:hypothetical protein
LFLILVVVVTVFVPAIAKIRDHANRQQCASMVRFLGLAVHNYYDTFPYLPPATMPNPSLEPEQRFSWLFSIYPFEESSDIYHKCDKTKSWDVQENRFAALTTIYWYRCPSVAWPPANTFFPTHYLGIAGVGKDAAKLPKDDPRAGFFGYDRKIKFDDIKDGTSYTLIAVETAWPRGSWTAGGSDTVRGLSAETTMEEPMCCSRMARYISLGHLSILPRLKR